MQRINDHFLRAMSETLMFLATHPEPAEWYLGLSFKNVSLNKRKCVLCNLFVTHILLQDIDEIFV